MMFTDQICDVPKSANYTMRMMMIIIIILNGELKGRYSCCISLSVDG